MLIGLAMQLRHVRYVRGGRDPSTGFDCSGFVRYVFEHALGLELPTNSASQYLIGHIVRRNDMQPGDLVFFRTADRRGRGRISHVGIYLSDGQFIHSPRRGESVRVDNLDDSYWAKHFAGARRPDAMAQIDSTTHSG
jgi:cell wall-associated NlpC family hydrolase